ncbi:acyltransferase family protein [Sphingopyxis sp. MWB1]|uniref:acyltransferase family protein n=1 Tax=Sphingopyxis sp. MWB1 TaxID=1537715 RepID=UPI000A5D21CF|nr:heparan-alpha-glucosaminide N-acetyltransferase domain-containing protein [Sphingopyxis sp. MWB1]
MNRKTQGMMQEPARARLASLDLLRGLAVMGMILVNAAAALFYSVQADVWPPLLHARWDGLTIADLVFPAFLLMVGVSIPFALARPAAEDGLTAPVAWQIGTRSLRLILIGFLLSNLAWFADFTSGDWRLFGVLQRIGLVYGACALLFLLLRPRALLILTLTILILYWPLALAPSLDGGGTDIWARGQNFIASVDRVFLGAGNHIYVKGPQGYDPEGVLGTLPAIAHGLIGVLIGIALKARPAGGSAGMLALAGAAMLGVGLGWSLWFPVIKDIWSSSFVLVTCGITTLALAALHHFVDGRAGAEHHWLARIAMAFGLNAIAAYVLHMVTAGVVGWDLVLLPYHWAAAWLPGEIASLLPILIYMALIWAAMEWLRRKNWIIKV